MARGGSSSTIRPKRLPALARFAVEAPSPTMRYLAQLAHARRDTGESLARALRVRSSTIMRYFEATHPRRETVERLARAIGVPLSKARALIGEMTKSDFTEARRRLLRHSVGGSCLDNPVVARDAIQSAFDRMPEGERKAILCGYMRADGAHEALLVALAALRKIDPSVPLPREPTLDMVRLETLAQALDALKTYSRVEILETIKAVAQTMVERGARTPERADAMLRYAMTSPFSPLITDTTYKRVIDAITDDPNAENGETNG